MNKVLEKPFFSLFQTQIFIQKGLLQTPLLRELCGNKKPILILDENLLTLYGKPLSDFIGIDFLPIPSGEKAKSQEVKEWIEKTLFERGYGRDSVLIAMGGGATSDVVGFIASTYLRGVSLILVPTTLLSIVDASIGGKTAINTSFGKNLIGTLYPSESTLIDLNVLSSLPEKEWINGLAEMLKIALIADKDLWNTFELNLSSFKEIPQILRAMEGKIRIVQQDPTEKGMRRLLNFGHTIGHALEALSEYTISHGEAVLIGCLVEAHLSYELGYLALEEWKRIQKVYSFFSFQLPKNYSRKSFFSALFFDKKKEKGQVRFVLVSEIGKGLSFEEEYCTFVSEKELENSLLWMEKNYG